MNVTRGESSQMNRKCVSYVQTDMAQGHEAQCAGNENTLGKTIQGY